MPIESIENVANPETNENAEAEALNADPVSDPQDSGELDPLSPPEDPANPTKDGSTVDGEHGKNTADGSEANSSDPTAAGSPVETNHTASTKQPANAQPTTETASSKGEPYRIARYCLTCNKKTTHTYVREVGRAGIEVGCDECGTEVKIAKPKL